MLQNRFRGGGRGLVKGVGDDCAVTRIPSGMELLVTTDSLMEEIHFRQKDFTPNEVGQKAVAISVSDIASMGGKPLYLFVSAFIPDRFGKVQVNSLFTGIHKMARAVNVTVAGGNLSSSEKLLVIDMTVLGTVRKGQAVYRSGAKPGDGIYVTGTIGDSTLGLSILNSKNPGWKKKYGSLVKRHKLPTPRLKEGAALSKMNLVSSMIDISDGLVLDLSRLMEASKTGAKVHLEQIPFSEKAGAFVSENRKASMEQLITGGEDYELLFAVPTKNERKLEKLGRTLKTSFHRIGEVTNQKGKIKVFRKGKLLHFKKQGWVHLAR